MPSAACRVRNKGAKERPGGEVQRPPLVEPGWRIEEVVVCNIATEPATRIYIPDGGTLIVHWREPRRMNGGRRRTNRRRRKNHA
jgi:hypothetical protein